MAGLRDRSSEHKQDLRAGCTLGGSPSDLREDAGRNGQVEDAVCFVPFLHSMQQMASG